MANGEAAPPTQRDIRQRVKVDGEDIGFYSAAWANGQMTKDDLIDKLEKNAAGIKDLLAQYDTAEP